MMTEGERMVWAAAFAVEHDRQYRSTDNYPELRRTATRWRILP